MNEMIWVLGYGCTVAVLALGGLLIPARVQSRYFFLLLGLAIAAPIVIWGLLYLYVYLAMSGLNLG